MKAEFDIPRTSCRKTDIALNRSAVGIRWIGKWPGALRNRDWMVIAAEVSQMGKALIFE